MKSVLTLLALAILPSFGGPPNSDSRFGTVGKTSEFQWHRFYNAEWDNLQSPASPTRMYTLAKLDARTEPGLQWCETSVPAGLCFRNSQASQRSKYAEIFEYEKSKIPLIVSHHNTINPSNPPPLRFVIGNEPNMFPYVDPVVYAEIYKKYYDYIKGPAPSGLNCGHCYIHVGGILLFDPFPETFMVSDIIGKTVNVIKDIKTWVTEKNEVTFYPYLDWTRRFLTGLRNLDGKVDVFDAHVYYGDFDISPLKTLGVTLTHWKSDPEALEKFISVARGGLISYRWLDRHKSLIAGVYTCKEPCEDAYGNTGWGLINIATARCFEDKNRRTIILPDDSPCGFGQTYLTLGGAPIATNMPYHYPNPVVWIGEFGSVQPFHDEAGVRSVMEFYVDKFKKNPNVEKWFWYRSSGTDPKYPQFKIPAWKFTLQGATVAENQTPTPVSMGPKVGLYSDENNTATRTTVGQKYLDLQDPAFSTSPTPRMAWAPEGSYMHLNIPQWSLPKEDIVQEWAFGNKLNQTAGWYFGGATVLQYLDGIKLRTSCSVAASRTLSAAEKSAITANGGRFIIVETGRWPEYSDFFHLQIRRANGAVVEIGASANFGGTANPLGDNRQGGVIDLQDYLGQGDELLAITYKMGVMPTGCNTSTVNEYPISRIYISKTNPVPGMGNCYTFYAASRVDNVFTWDERMNQSLTIQVPLLLTTQCGVSVTVDAASLAKGISYNPSGKTLTWTPTRDQVGDHVVTVRVGDNSYGTTKVVRIKVLFNPKPKPTFMAGLMGLLLD